MNYKKGQRVLILDGKFAGKVGVISDIMPRSRIAKVKVNDSYRYLRTSELSTLREPSSTWPEVYKLTGFIPEGVNIAR